MNRILFVDDEPNILQALRRSLRSLRNEWEMVFADGGVTALAQCASAPFDVVVSDARMPGMDGSEFLGEVMRRYPDTVRLILSGQCSRSSVLKCVAVAHQFLNKPCELGPLKSALRRLCKVRGSFPDGAVRRVIARVQQLPSQVLAYGEFADAIESPKASIDQLAGIIASDVAMTAKVVQLVSSGFFGSPQRVKDAVQATKLLGLDTVRELFASADVFQPRAEECTEEDLQRLTDHSLAVATAARRIAETLTDDPAPIGDAYLAGVLHKIGTLALIGRGRRHAPEPASSSNRHGAAAAGHAEGYPGKVCPDPGGYLVALWGVPEPVVQAITYQHDPARCPGDFSVPLTAVHVANTLVEQPWGAPSENSGSLAMRYVQSAGGARRLQRWREICAACRPEGVTR